MAQISGPDMVSKMALTGRAKADTSSLQLILRGISAGAIIGAATTTVCKLYSMENIPRVVGDFAFPLAFVLLTYTNADLLTATVGYALYGVLCRTMRLRDVPRVWGCILLGNILGTFCFALFVYLVHSDHLGKLKNGDPVMESIKELAKKKTAYFTSDHAENAYGFLLVFIKAIAANWFVNMAAAMTYCSTDQLVRIIGMWIPIFCFCTLGYEHVILNLFIIPLGWATKVATAEAGLLNLISAFLGNITGGLLYSGHMWAMYGKRSDHDRMDKALVTTNGDCVTTNGDCECISA